MKKQLENIKIPKIANTAIKVLEKHGYCAYIVGGFIRDCIMHRKVENADIDIATNAKPIEIKHLFDNENWVIYPLGEKFGTIGVMPKNNTLGLEGLEAPEPKVLTIEITTFRSEDKYSDARHPDKVEFKNTINDDLSRRDFTCNAIAYNPTSGLHDPYNGMGDIQNKIIKCVGDAKKRFIEDHLRILRALRFSAQLGFTIDKTTEAALLDMKDTINSVSAERIREELTKLLCGNNAKEVLTLYSDVIFTIIPELSPLYNYDQKTKYHSYDAWTHTLIVVDKTHPDEIARWAALLHDIGKPDCATLDEDGQGHFYGHPKRSTEISKQILRRLKFSNKKTDSILLLVRWHDQPMVATKKSVKKMLRKFAEVKTEYDTNKMFQIYCDLLRADSYAHAENYREYLTFMDEIEKVFDEIIAKEEAFSLRDLDINGRDIIKLGIKPGPKISEILNICLEKVISEEIPNNKSQLLKFVSTLTY